MAKKTKKKLRIDKTDADIFASLAKARRPLTIKGLAERTDLSWPTIKSRILKMKALEILETQKSIRRTNVYIKPEYRKKVKKLRRR